MNDQMEMLISMLNDVNEQVKTMEDLTDMSITDTYGMKTAIKNILEEAGLTSEEIKDLDEEKITQLYQFNEEKLAEIKADHINDESDEAGPAWLKEAKQVLMDISDSLASLTEVKRQRDELVAEKEQVLKTYAQYLNSPEYKAQREARIAELTKKCEEEKDEIKKTKLKRVLDSITSLDTLAFLFSRFTKDADAEIDNVVETFFDEKRSRYIIDKYQQKMKQLKSVDPRMYRFFFNLEETFLDEKYHVYNNLFLFFIMRFIAYAEITNRYENMYIRAIISNLYKLQYHEFASQSDEDDFKSVIMKLLDNFTEYYSTFEQDNTTHPTHPDRIKRDEETRVKELAMLHDLYLKEEWEFDDALPLATLKENYRIKYAEKYDTAKVVVKQSETTDSEHETNNYIVNDAVDIAKSATQPIQSKEASEEAN